MRLVKLAAALAAASASLTPAGAQTANNLFSDNEMLSMVSASDVAAMMSDLTIATQLVIQEGSSPVLLATTPSGGRFLFHFLSCENAAEAKNCANTVVTAALPSAGYTYDDINSFNGSAIVTTGVHAVQQQVILLGRNIIVVGGHSRELFKGTVYLFLVDVQKFVDMKQAANVISFSPTPDNASKIDAAQAGETSAAPTEMFGLSDLSAEVSAAIANTSGADFSIDYQFGR